MTKEEKIKEAWGEYYEKNKDSIDENGFMLGDYKSYPNIKFDVEDFTYLQPKSLKGIENNNGWIKIESEADLPKENIDCFFMFEGDLLLGSFFIDDKCFYWNDSRDFENKGVTHYQPIEKPKPPIY